MARRERREEGKVKSCLGRTVVFVLGGSWLPSALLRGKFPYPTPAERRAGGRGNPSYGVRLESHQGSAALRKTLGWGGAEGMKSFPAFIQL